MKIFQPSHTRLSRTIKVCPKCSRLKFQAQFRAKRHLPWSNGNHGLGINKYFVENFDLMKHFGQRWHVFGVAQSGTWALKKSLMRPSFLLYFWEVRKKRSHWPGCQSAPSFYNSYNFCPCARHAHVGKCGPWPKFKFSKTVEVGWSC